MINHKIQPTNQPTKAKIDMFVCVCIYVRACVCVYTLLWVGIYNLWLIDFNCMATCLGLFYA